MWGPHEGAPVLRRAGAGGRSALQEPRPRRRVSWASARRFAGTERGRTGWGSEGRVSWGRSAGLRGEGAEGGREAARRLPGVCTKREPLLLRCARRGLVL